jgi:uncharacterized SAM-binding protein YcdF (DUF218 family)
VVLGCRVRLDAAGRLAPGALARRVEMGASTYLDGGGAAGAATLVVASGGRRWDDHVEADAMARELVARGVPERAIARERCSLSTRDNARFTAEVLARRGIRRVTVVTCSWHLARAVLLFTEVGLEVDAVAARDGAMPPWPSRVLRWGRERILTRV